MKTSILFSLAFACVLAAGCGKESPQSSAPSPQAPSQERAESDVTPAPPSVTGEMAPPPPGANTAAAPTAEAIPPNTIKDSDPLGGNKRPLTKEEIELLNYGIYMFNQEKGRFPVSIEEAVTHRYILRKPILPDGERLDYNPQNGAIKVVKQEK